MAKDPSLSWIPLDEGGTQLAGEAPADPDCHVHAPGDLAALLYTSGTAGRPRAVMQTFGNIEHNTRAIIASLGLTPRDRALLGLPLSYCYGRSVLQTHLLLGASVFLEPRTSYPSALLQTIRAEECTGLAGVPLTFELLRRQARPDPSAMPSLRYLTQAGGAMAPETATWVREAFHPARLFQMYGQTEATARLTCLPPETAADRSGSVGVALPGLEIRVVDDDGREARRGETGHVVARGPSVTPGYYRAPEETARVLRGGWLWTGDLGWMDEDGYLFLCGRTKEILKIGGHRVAPEEIEAALAQHPGVVEAAAIGVSHPLMGEVAAVVVVAAPGSRLTEAELRRHCAERLPPYGVPRVYRFAPELPRNAAGKVERTRVAASLRPAGGPAPFAAEDYD
jgi:acyl-coenzyme A synthetase/AMP-(fatty) acid ligase